MERKLNSFSAHFADWCRAEQSRLLEQIRWLETGSRHVAVRTGDGPWVDNTANELMRLKLNFDRIERLLAEQNCEAVG